MEIKYKKNNKLRFEVSSSYQSCKTGLRVYWWKNTGCMISSVRRGREGERGGERNKESEKTNRAFHTIWKVQKKKKSLFFSYSGEIPDNICRAGLSPAPRRDRKLWRHFSHCDIVKLYNKAFLYKQHITLLYHGIKMISQDTKLTIFGDQISMKKYLSDLKKKTRKKKTKR